MIAIQRYEADLHIHTVASPCGEVEMIPPLIVAAAQAAGVDMIAITDHNCCENVAAVVDAAQGSGVTVLPGMEAQSVEGVHLLCLFDEVEQALALQETVYESLPKAPGGFKLFEEQFIVDASGEFVRYCEKPISFPTRMEIAEIWERCGQLGGICVPAHIDRSGTGLCDVLGMMPANPKFEAVEISANLTPEEARAKHPSIADLPIIQGSDAHWLDAIGQRRTVFRLAHRNIAEILKALRCEAGRRVDA